MVERRRDTDPERRSGAARGGGREVVALAATFLAGFTVAWVLRAPPRATPARAAQPQDARAEALRVPPGDARSRAHEPQGDALGPGPDGAEPRVRRQDPDRDAPPSAEGGEGETVGAVAVADDGAPGVTRPGTSRAGLPRDARRMALAAGDACAGTDRLNQLLLDIARDDRQAPALREAALIALARVTRGADEYAVRDGPRGPP